MQKIDSIHRLGILSSLALLASIFVGACAPVGMAVPHELSSKTAAMPVTTKKFWYIFDVKRLDFGTYVASDFNQGWTHGSNMSLNGFPSSAYSSSTYQQRYSFSMKPEQGPDWKCECGAKASEKTIESKIFGGDLTIPLMQRVTLTCSLQDSQNGAPWTLEMSMDGTKTEVFAGELSDGKKHVKVESTDRLEGHDFSIGKPAGYLFRDGDHVVGAVGTVNKEQVWLSPDAGPELRPQLATVASALLVYRDMLEELENGKEKK